MATSAVLPVLLGALMLPFDPAELQMPLDWTREREPPYPNLVASFRHRTDATLTVGRQFLAASEDGESFARGNAQALLRMGFRVRREGNALHGTSRNGRWAVRQIYLVRGTLGWAITLAGTPSQIRALRRDLGALLAQIEGN